MRVKAHVGGARLSSPWALELLADRGLVKGKRIGVDAPTLTTQHYPMLRRNLVYTGVTRGKRLVVIVEHLRAVGIAVRDDQSIRRWSKLSEWLQSPTSAAPAGMFVELRSWDPRR